MPFSGPFELPGGTKEVKQMGVNPRRIRRPAIERVPAYRQPVTSSTRRPRPRWLRALLWGLPLILLLAVLAGLVHTATQPPSLAQAKLAGTRMVTGPICLEEAVDVSGSLVAYARQRDQGEDEMFSFARRELRPDDLFSEAFFAGTGKLALAPTPMAKLSAPPAQPPGIGPDGTYLSPAVRALIGARSAGGAADRCASRALVVITDGLIDDSGPLATVLSQGHYTRVFAVIPAATGSGRPAQISGGTRNAITVYHFTTSSGLAARAANLVDGAQPLDVVFGRIISSLTGQRLVHA